MKGFYVALQQTWGTPPTIRESTVRTFTKMSGEASQGNGS